MEVAEQVQTGRFLLVRVHDNVRAGLPLHSIAEVTRPLPIEAISGAPAFVKGVAVIRASPIPVVDLAAILGIEGAGEATRFVVLCVGERKVAVAVESVIGIYNLQGQSLRHAPPLLRDAPGELVEAIAALDGELLFVLRVGLLLPDDLCEALSNKTVGG